MAARVLRSLLADFSLANPIYAGALVTVYEVDVSTWRATSTLATLYDQPAGTGRKLENPQRLDGEGKWLRPPYVDRAVVLRVSGGAMPSHDTGVTGYQPSYRGEWAQGETYLPGEIVKDGLAGANTRNLYLATVAHVAAEPWPTALILKRWDLYLEAGEDGVSIEAARRTYRMPEDYGAIGDGESHTAETVLGVSTLAELQAINGGIYPFADSIDNEMDYLGVQAAFFAGGVVRGKPEAKYRIDHTLQVPNGWVQPDFTHCDLYFDRMAEILDDGTNLIVNGDFAGADTSMWVNTLLTDPGTGLAPTPFLFNAGKATWVDGAIGSGPTHFGQFGQQIHIAKGKWTAEAWIKLSEGASRGYYGPPYCGFGFSNDHVGQGFPEWPDPLAKSATLSPGVDGVSTYLSFDFEVTEEEGRTVWMTFSGGNCNIEVDDIRVKPFRMNYAVWCSGDPSPFIGLDDRREEWALYAYDESVWTGGQLIGPNADWSPIFTGPKVGGFLHKSFRGEGSRCNWDGVHIRKFYAGITLSDQAFLQRFEGITIGYCDTCVKFSAGSLNAGENFRFWGCIFFNSTLAIHAEGGGEWFFFGTSWDYCRRFLKADREAYIASHGLHIEGHQAETYIPVTDWVDGFDPKDIITGSTSGATARVISDKGRETWDEGPRLVVQLLTGTFQVGETLTAPGSGTATVAAAPVVGGYMFDLRGGCMWNFVSGEILFAGYTHNGAPHVGRVETSMDQISFGSVWLYNLDAASGTTWTGGGRVTVGRHMGNGNPNLARLWLENHQSDAHGGMGDLTTEGGSGGLTLTDLLPEDGIPLDISLRAEGDRDNRTAFVGGPALVIDNTVSRVPGGSSLRLDVPITYGSGQSLGIRLLVPVSNGKIVMDRYFIAKPDVMPEVVHPAYVLGTPAENTATIQTINGFKDVTFSHDYADGLASAGVQPGWKMTISGLTGTFGGISAAVLNAEHTIKDVTEVGIIVELATAATASATTSLTTGATITYTQTNFLVWDRRMWIKLIGRTAYDNIPVISQDMYQGESNYTVPFAATDWMLGNPDGNRWWYTEKFIPDDNMDRIGTGRAPEWATHMLMDLNFWNLLYAVDGTAPPPVYLAGFFANVV